MEIKAEEVTALRRWQETRGKRDERGSAHERREYEKKKKAEKPEGKVKERVTETGAKRE